jgi:hypothetical protein
MQLAGASQSGRGQTPPRFAPFNRRLHRAHGPAAMTKPPGTHERTRLAVSDAVGGRYGPPRASGRLGIFVGPWRPHRQARNTEQSRYTQTCASLRHAPTATISRLKRDLPHIPACVSLASATHTSAMRRARGGANGVITGLAQSLRTNRDVRLILHSESDIAEVFRQIDDAACGFLGPFQAYRAKARR